MTRRGHSPRDAPRGAEPPIAGASCVCGAVAWEVDAERLELMFHCHCSRCRKAHGTPFATYVRAPADAFGWRGGGDRVVRDAPVGGGARPFCPSCGSSVPSGVPAHGKHVIPAGPFDDDPIARPGGHLFVASKAPWFDIADGLPRFDTYPPELPGRTAIPEPTRAGPPTAAQELAGSCLCGGITYVVTAEPLRWNNCHCSRCRKARSAAHASNLITADDGVRFTRGEELLAAYKIPEARYFMQVFCRVCGSPMPRTDPERKLAFIPSGSLDGTPAMRPQRHIFVDSKAPWFEIADGLPRHAEQAP